MNPRRLRLRNCRTFVELDLTLPEGRIAILGENGAGKSTVATAVDWALFGPDGRSWAPYLTQGAAETELLVELDFDHDGRLFKVRRGYSGRGSGKATLDLFVADELTLTNVPLTRETAKATQEFLEQLLGLTRETFRASSMLVQGDGAAFTEAQPRERKAILARILGLERWDGYLTACRADLRATETRLTQIAYELEGADEELAQRPEVEQAVALNTSLLTDAEERGKAAKAEAERAEAAIREAAQHDAARAVAAARMTQAEREVAQLQALEEAAAEAERQRAIAADELDAMMTPGQIAAATGRLAELERERATMVARIAEARQANQAREHALENAARLQGELAEAERRARDLLERAATYRNAGALEGTVPATCDHCGQLLDTSSAREHAANQLESDAAQTQVHARVLAERHAAIAIPEPVEMPDEAHDLSLAIATAAARAEAGRAAELHRARLEERIGTLDRQIAGRPAAEAAETAARTLQDARDALGAVPAPTDPAELARLTAARTAAEATVESERIRWQTASADLHRQQARLERIDAAAAKVETLAGERAKLHTDQDELKVLERAYGRDGIPAWIVAQVALPSIQAEGSRILAELGTSYQVELRSFRATGDGDVVDALDVIVITEDGERPYETFSGGERTRINLALRIALARLLANRRRGESRLLVIDEPEFLDGAGTAALVEVLRGLVDFNRIWLISHVPALRDAPLDGTIEVTRGEDGWSTATIT